MGTSRPCRAHRNEIRLRDGALRRLRRPYRCQAGPILSDACRRRFGEADLTIEGVSGQVADAVQTAWRRLDVVQCGYCQSGQIMSAIALLSDNVKPTGADIETAMNGNVCRCATYVRIRAAIHEASRILG